MLALHQALTSALSAASADKHQQAAESHGESGSEGPLADDEIFWMDAEGTISVPAAAKEGLSGASL